MNKEQEQQNSTRKVGLQAMRLFFLCCLIAIAIFAMVIGGISPVDFIYDGI